MTETIPPTASSGVTEVEQPPISGICRVCFPTYGDIWDKWSRYALVSPTGMAHKSEDSTTADRTFCGHNATGDNWWWPL